MKVCLVYPCIRGSGGWNSLGKSGSDIYIHHGLAILAAVLKKEGHSVDLIDFRECKGWDDVTTKMKSANADVFGVYMPTLDFHEAAKVSEIAKKLNVMSVVGGCHPSIAPEYVTKNTSFDFVFVGEGETTFLRLIENPQKFDKIVHGVHPNLDELPMEDRSIFNMKKIFSAKHSFYPSPFVNVIAGRGCPFRCGFCKPAEDLIFGKFRMRSVDNLMEEILFLKQKYNYKMLMIDDDSFTLNPRYVAAFCDAYKEIGRPFTIQSRVDFVVKYPKLFKQLKNVGLWMVVMGIESFNQRLLDFMNKDTTREQNFEAIKIANSVGVRVWANVMYGLPTETKQESLETLNAIRDLNIYHHSPSFYTPIVGSYLYDYCKEHDLLLSDDPALLGCRSPTEPKIRGVDYTFLNDELKRLRLKNLKILTSKQKVFKVWHYGLKKIGLN